MPNRYARPDAIPIGDQHEAITALDRGHSWAVLACTNTVDYIMDRDIRGARAGANDWRDRQNLLC